jgi:DNA (cytosine-5)-methyltransferase 1
MPTPHKFWRNDRTMDCSKLSQFGLTCKVLEPTTQIAQTLLKAYAQSLLTLSSAADSPAKTLAQQEKAQASRVSAAACGKNMPVLLAKYDQLTHSLKTAQCSLFEDLTPCLVTLPRTGTMHNGMCYLRKTLAQTINATAFGFLPNGETFFHTPNTSGLDGGSNGRKALKKRQQNWLTPTVNMISGGANHNSPQVLAGKHGINLEGAVMKNYPTPQASDNRDRGNLSDNCVKRRIAIGKQISLSQSVSEISGALNPTWVEWLMGVPLGWSDLKPLVTRKYRFALQPHLHCLEKD